MGRNTQCEQLCTVTVSEHDADEAKRLVQEEYRVEWYVHHGWGEVPSSWWADVFSLCRIVDNLPGATVLKYNASSETSTALLPYFPLGQVKVHKYKGL